jgi:hypothetical protein
MAAMRLALQEAASGPISERARLPQASVFNAFPLDGIDGVEPLSSRDAELLDADADADEDGETRVFDPATQGFADAAPDVALRLPSLDSHPNAGAAPLPPHTRVTTTAAVSSTRGARPHDNRRAAAIGISIAVMGILVALVLVALRTNYVPGLTPAAQPLPPPSSSTARGRPHSTTNLAD